MIGDPDPESSMRLLLRARYVPALKCASSSAHSGRLPANTQPLNLVRQTRPCGNDSSLSHFDVQACKTYHILEILPLQPCYSTYYVRLPSHHNILQLQKISITLSCDHFLGRHTASLRLKSDYLLPSV